MKYTQQTLNMAHTGKRIIIIIIENIEKIWFFHWESSRTKQGSLIKIIGFTKLRNWFLNRTISFLGNYCHKITYAGTQGIYW